MARTKESGLFGSRTTCTNQTNFVLLFEALLCITVDSIEHPQHPWQWYAICSTISSTNFTLNDIVAFTPDLASIVYCCAVLCYDKLHCAPASTLLALALPMSAPCLKSSSSKTCNVPSAIATPVSAPSRSSPVQLGCSSSRHPPRTLASFGAALPGSTSAICGFQLLAGHRRSWLVALSYIIDFSLFAMNWHVVDFSTFRRFLGGVLALGRFWGAVMGSLYRSICGANVADFRL